MKKSLIINSKQYIFITVILTFSFFIPKISSDKKIEKFINKGNCFIIDKSLTNLFNLKSINFTIENNSEKSQKIILNFCENKSLKEINPSLVKLKTENKTISMYDNSYKTKLWYYDSLEKILKIRLITNQTCLNKEKVKGKYLNNSNITFLIKCDLTKNGTFYENSPKEIFEILQDEYNCNKEINFYSKELCPKPPQLDLHKFYLKYCYIFGLNYIVWGFFMLTYGNLFEKIVIYLYGYLFIRMILMIIEDYLFSLINNKDKFEWIMWSTEILNLIVGYFFSKFTRKYKNSKYWLLGFLNGGVLAYYNFLIFCYFIRSYELIFYYLNNISFMLIGGYVSHKYFINSANYLIFSCGLVGSNNIILVK